MAVEKFTPELGTMGVKGTGKILNMFFIVDISGSMRGERIEAINDAFTQMLPALRKIQMDCMSEFELRIAILTFSQYAQWLVTPTPIMEYNHNDIDCTDYVTYYSRAFEQLQEKLSSKEYMAHTGKIAEPYIMFLTDGEPSPGDDYEPVLDKLLDNGWFMHSQRFAVMIGKEAIDSAEARKAVRRFITGKGGVINEKEGIINASDAVALASVVQAKTIHTINVATKHGVETGDEEGGSGSEGGLFGDNVSGDSGDLSDYKDYENDVYGEGTFE